MYRNQPLLPDTPTDLFAYTTQPQASATRPTDTTTWIQPLGGTNVTLGDVQALMDIQSRQFHQSMIDNLHRLQARMTLATQELSNDNTEAIQEDLRRDLRQETTAQATQAQEQLMQTRN
jgi:hypothetical protein